VLTATLLGIAQGGWISGQMFDLTSSCRAAYVNSVLWNLMNLSIVSWLQGRLRRPAVAPGEIASACGPDRFRATTPSMRAGWSSRPRLAAAFQMPCISRMSRSATLPPVRVAPETKASIEAVLRESESMMQFIENAVCREAQFCAEQNAAVARAKKALRRADKGAGLMTAEDFPAGMEQRAKAARADQELLRA
jgi:hypothetical protein